MEIIDLISRYGDFFYGIVAAWTFLEGETIVIFSGIAAREGMVNLTTLVACAWAIRFISHSAGMPAPRCFAVIRAGSRAWTRP
jgi:membrane protein DedA with SNARE-associated domain